MPGRPDTELVVLAREGSSEAAGALFDRYWVLAVRTGPLAVHHAVRPPDFPGRERSDHRKRATGTGAWIRRASKWRGPYDAT